MFYVYVYRDPRPSKNGQPVYVGKGKDRRAWDHWRWGNTRNKVFNNWLTHLRRLKLEPIIDIVERFEDESSAHAKECELIALYGRRHTKTGPLFNLTAGGDGVAGLERTKEWRRKVSAALSTPENVERNSRLAKERWADPAFHETMTEKIRTATRLPENAARREAAKAISHRTPEFRAKIGVISTAMWQDPEYRERTKASMLAAQSSSEALTRKAAETKAGWKDPEIRAKRIAGIKASRTPELRAQIGASCKALWDDAKRAEQSAKMKAVLASPEAKAARGAAMRARWNDPAKREALLAAQREKKLQP